jgi:hypothetical protein
VRSRDSDSIPFWLPRSVAAAEAIAVAAAAVSFVTVVGEEKEL